MTGWDLLRGHEIGGISVEASGSEEAAPSSTAPSSAAGPAHHTRRSWSAEEKARIVAESDEPGVVQKEVAARHGISPPTLRQWRSRARAATGKRHGRPWPDDVKAQIVSESERPDASISAVARRHGISEKTLRTWRRQAASGAGGDRRGAKSAWQRRAVELPPHSVPCAVFSSVLRQEGEPGRNEGAAVEVLREGASPPFPPTCQREAASCGHRIGCIEPRRRF